MTKDWESVFSLWAQAPSQTEEKRCENAVNVIVNAISASPKLKSRNIKVFTQGSYRNRVNVRQDSDVDVGVMLYDYFLRQYPGSKTDADFGNRSAGYAFTQFKDEVEEALVAYLGRDAVKRGNKAFDVKATSYHVEADVVPFFEFRQYWEDKSYRAGVALIPDSGGRIENYPECLLSSWPQTPLHYENGVAKNTFTSRRFKGLVRILKSLRNEMASVGHATAAPIPGYLLECMMWNVPKICFDRHTWDSRVQAALAFLWSNTRDDHHCNSWCEVDAIKFLFRIQQPWKRSEAHAFIGAAWGYVGMRSP